MVTDENKEKILQFLKTQMLGVISTVASGSTTPESAVVAFSETDDLELIFGTFCDTRKYHNIQSNPNISFVIGWTSITIQYEGVAQEARGSAVDTYRDAHLTKNLPSRKFAFDDRQRFFKVSPTWIRYSDLSQSPPEIFELSFL